MKSFGFGIMKDMFMFFRGCAIKAQNTQNVEVAATAKIYTKATEQEVSCVATKESIVTDKDENGNSVFNDKVIYIRWPLRAQLFVDMRPDNAGQIELQCKNGPYKGNDNKELSRDDIRGLDVMQIPELIHVPILSPVMQDERIMNVDILTERGIFIGLSKIDSSLYYEALGEEYTDPVNILPKKEQSSAETIPMGTTGIGGVPAMPFEPHITLPQTNANQEPATSLNDIKDIVWEDHGLGSDVELSEPEKSDVYGIISLHKVKND